MHDHQDPTLPADPADEASAGTVGGRWRTVNDPLRLVAIADTIFDAVSSVYENDRPSPIPHTAG